MASEHGRSIIADTDRLLVTGATGFIGVRVVEALLQQGFRDLVCLARVSSDVTPLEAVACRHRAQGRIEVVRGNLLSREDCARAVRGVAVILHLAAGAGEKSFPDAFANSVVATRNLLDASLEEGCLRRFVLVSSFAVYTNIANPRPGVLDESGPVEERPALRGDAYCFAKVKQEAIVREYGERYAVPYVILRPGAVYGPGKREITGRVGIGTFGVFVHLGGSNRIPFTYVDNCAEAIVLAASRPDVDGEVFNVVDDDLPSSRTFLRLYKRNVAPFASIYLPHVVSRVLCHAWERYATWSRGQLPPVFNGRRWHAEWKRTRYPNAKIKAGLGWTPRVPMAEGLRRYYESCVENRRHA
jgi:nucleoside-diphosphate-sugar epimerase